MGTTSSITVNELNMGDGTQSSYASATPSNAIKAELSNTESLGNPAIYNVDDNGDALMSLTLPMLNFLRESGLKLSEYAKNSIESSLGDRRMVVYTNYLQHLSSLARDIHSRYPDIPISQNVLSYGKGVPPASGSEVAHIHMHPNHTNVPKQQQSASISNVISHFNKDFASSLTSRVFSKFNIDESPLTIGSIHRSSSRRRPIPTQSLRTPLDELEHEFFDMMTAPSLRSKLETRTLFVHMRILSGAINFARTSIDADVVHFSRGTGEVYGLHGTMLPGDPPVSYENLGVTSPDLYKHITQVLKPIATKMGYLPESRSIETLPPTTLNTMPGRRIRHNMNEFEFSKQQKVIHEIDYMLPRMLKNRQLTAEDMRYNPIFLERSEWLGPEVYGHPILTKYIFTADTVTVTYDGGVNKLENVSGVTGLDSKCRSIAYKFNNEYSGLMNYRAKFILIGSTLLTHILRIGYCIDDVNGEKFHCLKINPKVTSSKSVEYVIDSTFPVFTKYPQILLFIPTEVATELQLVPVYERILLMPKNIRYGFYADGVWRDSGSITARLFAITSSCSDQHPNSVINTWIRMCSTITDNLHLLELGLNESSVHTPALYAKLIALGQSVGVLDDTFPEWFLSFMASPRLFQLRSTVPKLKLAMLDTDDYPRFIGTLIQIAYGYITAGYAAFISHKDKHGSEHVSNDSYKQHLPLSSFNDTTSD